MSETTNRSVNIYIETGDAQKALDVLLNKQKAFTDEIAKSTDPKRIETLKTGLAKLEEPIDRATKKLKGELSPTVSDLQKTVNDLGNRFKKLSTEDADYSKVISQYKQASKALDEQKDKLSLIKKGHEEAGSSFAKIFEHVAEYTSAYFLIEKAAEGIKEFFSGTIEEANKAEEANAKLRNSLENAGRADLFETLTQQAEKFHEAYKRINPNDIKDIFTKLVDYGKLSQNQITSLTDVIINYAAKQKVSVQDATDVFTKALEGNSKGLRTYGIDISAAHTVTDRFNIVVGQMSEKLKGSELAFEQTRKGGWEVFKEGIVSIQEKLGDFIFKLTETKKGSNELFDEAKEKSENYEHSLGPLLQRYDELKSKTTLNKDEQTELHGIVAKIVEIMPSAATEIDKYGNAMDINRAKVTSFLAENKKFLAEKEFKAVDDITSRTLETLKGIDALRKNINSGVTTDIVTGGSFGAPATSIARNTTDEERKQLTSELRAQQEKLINDADILTNKYGVKLPESVKKAVEAISGEFAAVKQVDSNTNKYSIDWYNAQIDEAKKKLNSLTAGTLEFKKQSEELQKLIETRDAIQKGVIGNGNPDIDKNADKEAARKREEALKKMQEDQKKLLLDLEKFKREYSIVNQDAIDKEVEQANEKRVVLDTIAKNEYEQALIAFAGNKQKIKEADINYKNELKNNETAFYTAVDLIRDKFAKAELEKFKKDAEAFEKANIAYFDNSLKDAESFLKRYEAILKSGADKDFKNSKESLDIQIAQSTGKKKYDLQVKELDLEEKYAIDNASRTGESVQVIHEKFAEKRDQLDKDRFNKTVKDATEIAGQTMNLLSIVESAQTAKENAELARDQKLNDKKKQHLQDQLNSGLISQKKFDAEVSKLQQEQDKRQHEIALKQFKRQQIMAGIQAVINGAEGVTKIIAETPKFDFGVATAIEIALAVATTAAQVAIIASQKPPELAHGGILRGPSHANGGIPMVHTGTGQQIAEAEGGEGVVNKRTMSDKNIYSLTGTPSGITSLLNGLNGVEWDSNATFHPVWSTVKPAPMNFSQINSSLNHVRMFASGGVVASSPSGSQGAGGSSQPELTGLFLQVMDNVNQTLSDMQGTLASIQKTGIQAFVPITHFNDQQTRLNNIIDDATMKSK